MRLLIVDGYPESARQELDCAGVTPASQLFGAMLAAYESEAEYEVVYPSDSAHGVPELTGFQGVLWTGCNLTIHDTNDPRIAVHLELARRTLAAGLTSFGSCWAIQLAAVVAGGRVQAHPQGREIGVSRKIRLTEAGRRHPMFEGKPPVFDGFTSHLDEVCELPPGASLLAESAVTAVQALEVVVSGTLFWATQYHTEFTVEAMGRLLQARRQALIREGFFADEQQAERHSRRWLRLAEDPGRRDYAWQMGLDRDLLDADVRRLEFANWLKYALRRTP